GQPWTDVTNAIKAFVDQPSAAGIGVGLQYFPPTSSTASCPAVCPCPAGCGPCFGFICTGSGSGACNVADYAAPAVVIQNLPGIAAVIKSNLDMTMPSGNTPTSAALDGAIQYTKQWMTMNPNAVGVTIFATDGDPTECNTNLQSIYGIAAAGLSGTPSVKTYVIGVGDLAFLDDLAAAGGTGTAFKVDKNANAQQDFLQAMNSIRGAALSCAYLIPPAPAGEMIDYNAINVQYTPTGGMPTLIPKAASPAACPPAGGGMAWYYDNNSPPQQILLCPGTCSQISADTSGQIDVLVGCATVIN
ncbi:MAG TPA: vWA domain-containing protein, partial [Polyangium sp.]|nr:vWA domain-containing protein [Polyangium sp.]